MVSISGGTPRSRLDYLVGGGVQSDSYIVGGHKAAGGLVAVREQHLQLVGFLAAEELEQSHALAFGDVAQEVHRLVHGHPRQQAPQLSGPQSSGDLDLVRLVHLQQHPGRHARAPC